MSELSFWNAWPKPHRLLFQTLLGLLGASFIYYLVGYFWSARLVIQWETISNITTFPLLLESWRIGTIPFDIEVNQYLISQVFAGSDLMLANWPALALLVVLAICLTLGLTLVTGLSRFWFLISQVVFIFIMASFKLEQLLLFNRTDKVALIMAFLLYLPASYYFHAVKKQTPLLHRLLVFTLLTAIFGVAIQVYSGVSNPFLYIVNYGIPVPLALTVVFILLTSHEIIYGFLVLITRANTPNSSNSFFHFFALSLIYLGNVLLVYLRNTNRIEWDFYYLDAYWILIVTAIVGIWSLRQRAELFQNIIAQESHAVLGYLVLAIISFSTIGYFFATANDPAIEALEDAIVFGQLCIGFVFLLYILFNFRSVLIANLKVYKVVYKPKKMPFFSMRLGGFIGVLGLFLLSNQYPLDQAITAYYNGIGDLHRIDDKPLLAKEYYKLAAIYAKTNHRSNYAIAAMAYNDNDLSEALAYSRQSIIKQPTPFAYVNTARLYEEQGSFFKAMFTLKDGLEKFPGEPHIANNLSSLYAKTDVLDSAYYYLNYHSNQNGMIKTAQTNQLALLARSGVELALDSIILSTSHREPEVGNNLILLANGKQHPITTSIAQPTDTLLNPITFSWWYNYHLNHRYLLDSQQMAFTKALIDNSVNQFYSDELDFARIVRLYYSGEIQQAFNSLNALKFRDTGKSGLYNDLLGQWSLQHRKYLLAASYFGQSAQTGYLPALWHQTVALIATGQFDVAAESWNSYVYEAGNLPSPDLSELLTFCRRPAHIWDTLSSQEKFWYLQFNTPELPLERKQKLLGNIPDSLIRVEATNWFWNLAVAEPDSGAWLNLNTRGQTALQQLRWAVVTKDYSGIASALEQFSPSQDPQELQWIRYGNALLLEQTGNVQAASLYQAISRNPFFETGILDAARYFRIAQQDDYKAYELLLEALSINKYSVPLLKAYGLQCTRLNLDTYRDTTLETLKSLLTATEFQNYLNIVKQTAAENELKFSQ